MQSIVREWFNSGGRYVHTFSATVISIFSRQSYSRRHHRAATARSKAWQSWWDDVKHLGTFNALIEREGLFASRKVTDDVDRNADDDSSSVIIPTDANQQRFSSSPLSAAAAAAAAAKLPVRGQQPSLRRLSNSLRHRFNSQTTWQHFHYSNFTPPFFNKSSSRSRPVVQKINSGTHLFGNPGQILTEHVLRRGLMEDARFAIEVGISKIFSFIQSALRTLFLLEKPKIYMHEKKRNRHQHHDDDGNDSDTRDTRHQYRNGVVEHGGDASFMSTSPRLSIKTSPFAFRSLSSLSLSKSSIHGARESRKAALSGFTAADAILLAGYPLEEHTATTPDGYVLLMHRIPRKGGKDVLFLQHGVLDTSLGWVANGPGGSIAFSAYDDGFDVWLANTRSNPPRVNVKKDKQGARYWKYSANDLAMGDLPTQMNYIHRIKLAELVPVVVDGQGISNSSGKQDAVDGELPSWQPDAQHETLADMTAVDTTVPLRRTQSDPEREIGGALLSPSLLPPATPSTHLHGGATRTSYDTNDIILLHHINSSSKSAVPLVRSMTAARSDSAASTTVSTMPAFLDPLSSAVSTAATTTATSGEEHLPYRLQAVGHSLGGACLLMYAVACKMTNQPHRLRRLVLLSPAGFHIKIPWMIKPCVWIIPFAVRIVQLFRPNQGVGLRLPSPMLRWIAFKLVADLQRSPATLDLLKASMKIATGGDASAWDKAIALPHYSTQSMPAVSLHTANQFAQWAIRPEFRLYDYGSPAKNRVHYGSDAPPSIAQHYHVLKDIPVDVVAGTEDGLVPPENVACHLRWLRGAGVKGEFREYAYGHLAFTFGVRDEVVQFVLSRLRQTSYNFSTR